MTLSFGQLAGLMAGSAGASFFGNLATSAINSSRQYKYSRDLMNQQFLLNQKSLLENPQLARSGYEKAGYNPLLALGGQNYGVMPSATAGMSDSDNGSQAVGSALQAQEAINNTKLANSNSALASQQAETEKSKRINYDFQNAMLDVQKHIHDKELSWYDRRANMELYELFQRAERYQAQSAIDSMNAQTAKSNMLNQYELGKYHNETERYKETTSGWGFSHTGYVPEFQRYSENRFKNMQESGLKLYGYPDYYESKHWR